MAWNVSSWIPDLRQKVTELSELPPIPEVAHAVLRLRDHPQADAKRLARLIELDPSLAAQIMRCASSAFFGYRGKIESVQDAVSRVLGFEKALYISAGLAAGQALRHSKEGPLGVRAYWVGAVYSAALMQALGAKIPAAQRPNPGLVYLAGLVRNIGILLLGHLLEPEFDALNRAVEEQPERPLTEIEAEVLGVSHCDLGLWLLRKWKLPTEVLVTVFNHHNPDYRGEAAVYPQLALVADCLLKRHGIGDGETEELPQRVMDALGLRPEVAEATLEAVLAEREGLDALVSQVLRAA